MRKSLILLSIGTAVLMPTMAMAEESATPEFVDLSTWSEEGPGGGVWSLSDDNKSVYQSVNSVTPTFFISDDPYVNKSFNGVFNVSNGERDNDFAGFVFGYNAPFAANGDAQEDFDFYLLDWKKEAQAGAEAGLYFSRVTGTVADNINHMYPTNDASHPLWTHESSDDSLFTLIDSHTGNGLGWETGIDYTFTTTYNEDQIQLNLDGGVYNNDTIFNITGDFDAGSFGFYNFSQASVTYSEFAYADNPEVFGVELQDVSLATASVDTAPAPTLGSGLMGLVMLLAALWHTRKQGDSTKSLA